MSIPGIPGLGQLASTQAIPPPSATRTITLQPLTEWRFQAAHTSSPPLQLRLVHGTAERDGTELAPQRTYTFVGAASKILTWHGCTLEVSGPCNGAYTAPAEPAGAVAALNLAFALRGGSGPGPRVLVCGGPATGKSTLARTLVALGVRGGLQPLLASVDPRDGMLSLPGTVSVAAFATRLDVESADGGTGVGGTPSSGPSAVPVKVPLVYYVGRERPTQALGLWCDLTGLLGRAALDRMRTDGEVGKAGVVVDAPATDEGQGNEVLEHVVQAFDVNTIIVLGSPTLHTKLQGRYGQERTRAGEPIHVLGLDKSSGVVERDALFMQQFREAAIKEYFFGDAKRTLSPFTQSVGFADVTIYAAPVSDGTGKSHDDDKNNNNNNDNDDDTKDLLLPVAPSVDLCNCTLAVMHAALGAGPASIRRAPVLGFVYVAEVDGERGRLKVLAPMGGRVGDRPMVWGRWPEPYIGLLG